MDSKWKRKCLKSQSIPYLILIKKNSILTVSGGLTSKQFLLYPPQMRADYVLNLSILIRTGKENNSDSTSNGE